MVKLGSRRRLPRIDLISDRMHDEAAFPHLTTPPKQNEGERKIVKTLAWLRDHNTGNFPGPINHVSGRMLALKHNKQALI